MAVNDFDSHLTDVGNALDEFRQAVKVLEDLRKRHNHNGYSTLASTAFDGRAVDKTTYDLAMSTVVALLDTWLVAGHGTNIDKYLFEVP